jgi:Radical SAM superfamily
MSFPIRSRIETFQGALGVAWTLANRSLVVGRAHHLQVMVSDRCNLACAGCFKSGPVHRPLNRDLSVERFDGLLSRLRPRVVTLVAEGDPLLHPDLELLVSRVRARRARALMATGLTVGDPERLRALIAAGLHGARVILSHTDRETYRQVKGRDLLPDILERLEVFAADPRLALVVELWFAPQDLDQIEASFPWLLDAGVTRARYLVHPTLERPRLRLDRTERGQLEAAAARAEALGLRNNLRQIAGRGTPNGSDRARCALPWLRAYVHIDGRMGPCVDVVNGEPSDGSIHLPDAFDSQSDEPFSGTEFQRWRRAFRRGQAPHRVCEGCQKGCLGSVRGAARLRMGR